MVRSAKRQVAVTVETTQSVCPWCFAVVEASIVEDGGRIFMHKTCLEHGDFRVLLSSDAEWYHRSFPFNKPGTTPRGYSTGVKDGCPNDCGLCPDHIQHTCLALIEINSDCNLACPTCYADSRPGFRLTVEQVGRMLDNFVKLETEPGVIQISGGEPTLHPDILPILRLAKRKRLRMVMLNTNGIRIAEDDAFLAGLADVKPTIYLQFDGFNPSTYERLRGRDILSLKLKALDRLAQAKIDAVLVPTIKKGVNHDEVGAIVKFGLSHPAVRGICFQPVTLAGRLDDFDPLDHETVPDIIHGIAGQSDGMLVESDFVPVPCCHPTCRSATYLYVDNGKVTPLPRVLPVDKYLDYITNSTLPNIKPEVLKALEGLWSASSVPGSRKMASRFKCAICDLPFFNKAERLKKRVFTIVVQDFADAYTMDLNVIRKCCVGELVPDGRIIPFCAYNSLGYREKVWAALAAGEMK
ncbi:MAG: radical SAM protein [Chloroflexi bacterium]|nr:radical SAM protein [Chloroflexota bacterium]